MSDTFDRHAMAKWYARIVTSEAIAALRKFCSCLANRPQPRFGFWKSIGSYPKQRTWSQSILASPLAALTPTRSWFWMSLPLNGTPFVLDVYRCRRDGHWKVPKQLAGVER